LDDREGMLVGNFVGSAIFFSFFFFVIQEEGGVGRDTPVILGQSVKWWTGGNEWGFTLNEIIKREKKNQSRFDMTSHVSRLLQLLCDFHDRLVNQR
jgi:hypothetical protein